MADDKKAKSGDDSDFYMKLTLGLVGALLVALVVIPAVLGYLLYYATRNMLGRREAWAMVAIALTGFALRASYCFSSYATWLKGLIMGETSLAELPVLSLALMALLVAGLLSLLSETKLTGRFGPVLAPKGTVVRAGRAASGRTPKRGHKDDLLPDIDSRQKAWSMSNVVAVPGRVLTVDAASHSILDPTQPGERTFPLGVALDGTPVSLNESELGHGLILGSTGSGKSETIKTLAGCLLDLGWDGMILDLKEDTATGGLRDWCFDYSATHSTPFQELRLSSEDNDTWFNPLAGMGPDEMRDMVLELNEFEAAYYEALNKELLGQVVNLLVWAHEADPRQFAEPTMYDIAKICGASSLPAATKKMRAVVQACIPGVEEEFFRVLANPSKAQQESATGFASRVGNIYDSQAGRMVLRAGSMADGRPRQPLNVTANGLTYIGLDSQGRPDLTRVVSSTVLQRMSVYAAQRTRGAASKSKPRFLIIDEANWVNRQITQNLLSRARGAGISMWLCTQGPKDWIDKTGDDWGKLTNNINVAVIMRQGEPESAVLCAEYLGKKMQDKVSERVSQTASGLVSGPRRVRDSGGRLIEEFSVAQELDYRVPPDKLRELTVGEALIRVGTPALRFDYARITRRDPKTSPPRR